MTAPHPQRCETCDFHTENQYMDFCHGYSMSSDDSTELIVHISRYGCASHSTASNDNDLDTLAAWIREYQSCKDSAYMEVVLLPVLEKIEQLRQQHQEQL